MTGVDIWDRLQMTRYINAHDTYTIYGGSRMAENTIKAMEEISRHFVDIAELQKTIGEKIAEMTQNEGAYVTNGASGALLLAASVCMAGDSDYRFMRLPDTTDCPNEMVVFRCQRNAYDKAVSASGAKMVEIGDADETLACELEGVLGPQTAAVFYFLSTSFARASMPLQEVIRIAHSRNVPVVVDAAAQLPPVENLWKYTKMGADLVIFSGGKTLCGPQDSGLMVGRKALTDLCLRYGAPVHGICRSSKVSREGMVGLYVALENYLQMDHEAEGKRLLGLAKMLASRLAETGRAETRIVPIGPVGQSYPRMFARLPQAISARQVRDAMEKAHIYIGLEEGANEIYISPLNLTEAEADIVAEALCKYLAAFGCDA